MRIDLALLSDYIDVPLTGVGRYAFEIASRLNSRRQEISLRFSSYRGIERWCDVQSRVNAPVDERGFSLAFRYRLINMKVVSTLFEGLQLVNQRRLLRNIGENAVIHAPSVQRLCARVPRGAVRVVTVHDLSHIIDASWHPTRRLSRIQGALKDIASVDRVIAVSSHTKSTLVDYFNVDPQRVTVVRNGISDSFIEINTESGPRRHTLCVSTIEPRKNIETLISAYASLPEQLRLEYPLIVVGSTGWNSAVTHALINRYQAEGWLSYRGYVDQAKLCKLYARAKLCVYPSKYEGFGLPILEALAAGCRVIAGNHSSIPEVSGGHACLLADVTDTEQMRTAINNALSQRWEVGEETPRAEYAKNFTWDTAVDRTIDTYRDALATR